MPVLIDETKPIDEALLEYQAAVQLMKDIRDATYPAGAHVELQANQGPRIGIVVDDHQCPPDMICATILGSKNPPLCYHLSKVNKHE